MSRLHALRLLAPFAAGILLCELLAAPPLVWLAAAIMSLAAARRRPRCGEAAFGLALGGLALAVRLAAPVPELDPRAASVSVELLEAPRRSGPLCSAVVRVYGARPGRALLRASGSACAALPGDLLRARLVLEPFDGERNPGGASPRHAWARRGVHRVARIADGLYAPVRSDPGVRARVESLRRRFGAAVDDGSRAGRLLRALTTGVRDGVGPGLRARFEASGTAHLLAVSGLHVACVYATATYLLAGMLRRAPWVSWVRVAGPCAGMAGAAAALAYAGLAGFGVPALRAVAMAAAGTLAVLSGRPAASANALALAAGIVLAFDPSALFSAGFALSFSAVAGILAWRPPARGVAALWHTSCAAGLATAPWATAAGLPLAWSAPLANLIAVPVFGLAIVPLALLTGAVDSVHPVLSGLLRPLPLGLTEAALRVLEGLGSADPLASCRAPVRVAGGAAGAAFACRIAWRSARPALYALALPCAALAVSGLAPGSNARVADPEIWFLDVGHGDAILVRSADSAWLLDAGPRFGRADAGRRVVAPALRALGVRRLDVLAVTHSDRDHIGGAASVLSRLPVGELWLSAAVARHAEGRQLLRVAALRRVPVRLVQRGTRARVGDLVASVRWPPVESVSDGNAGSLVLRVEGREGCAMLPGDVPDSVERRLADETECAVLALAHHGSGSSSSGAWLDRLRPVVAVASAGRRRRGPLPHPAVRARLRGRDVTLYVTREHGAVRVAFAEPGLVVAPFLP